MTPDEGFHVTETDLRFRAILRGEQSQPGTKDHVHLNEGLSVTISLLIVPEDEMTDLMIGPTDAMIDLLIEPTDAMVRRPQLLLRPTPPHPPRRSEDQRHCRIQLLRQSSSMDTRVYWLLSELVAVNSTLFMSTLVGLQERV